MTAAPTPPSTEQCGWCGEHVDPDAHCCGPEHAALRERIQTLCDHWEQYGDDISITAVRATLDGPS